jgi:hypothetical protein
MRRLDQAVIAYGVFDRGNGVPGADDVNYQPTSFHDALYNIIRDLCLA